jgi:hypothetical protein
VKAHRVRNQTRSTVGRNTPMEIGLTRKRVLETLRIYLVIGLIAAICGVISIFLADSSKAPTNVTKFWLLMFLFLMPSGIWLFLCTILCSITLRVSDGVIEQVLWKHFVLKRQPISALTKISGGGFSALVLHFRGGVRIALPGIHIKDKYEFLVFLDKLRPELDLLA